MPRQGDQVQVYLLGSRQSRHGLYLHCIARGPLSPPCPHPLHGRGCQTVGKLFNFQIRENGEWYWEVTFFLPGSRIPTYM